MTAVSPRFVSSRRRPGGQVTANAKHRLSVVAAKHWTGRLLARTFCGRSGFHRYWSAEFQHETIARATNSSSGVKK